MENQIKIGIIETHDHYRNGIKNYLESKEIFKVVYDVTPESNIISDLDLYQPNIILLDIQLSNELGIEILKLIRSLRPQQIVIVITNFPHSPLQKMLGDASPDAVFPKHLNASKLEEKIIQLYNEGGC
jgi:DNA-binding NarL/FixJ family response regulator